MKNFYCLAPLLFLVISLFSQQILRVNESSSSFSFTEAEVIGDSLLVYYMDSLDHQLFGTTKNFKLVKFGSGSGFAQSPNEIESSGFICLDFSSVQLDSSTIFKAGTEFTAVTTANPKPHVWYHKGSLEDFDSLKHYQFIDTTYTFFTIRKSIVINGTVYTFGGAAKSDYPYTEMFIIKHNLSSFSYNIATYEMPTAFDLVNDVIYRDHSNEFIVSTTSQLGSGQIPYGAAISKIDTNLLLDTSSIGTLQVSYASYLLITPNPYEYHNAFLELANNKLLIIGMVTNESRIGLSSIQSGWDLAVGIRDLDSLSEIGPSNIMGKKDTADNLLVGDLKLKSLDSNRFLTVVSSRFINREPEPWNTTASVYGIDAQANKRWEYHLDMQDYCWVRDFYPSNDGGLWIINQCSENLDPLNGTYDYFIKVAYLDSTVFWPGVLTDVVEPELKASELKIYPNPVSEQLNIEQYGQIVPLEGLLFNMGGKLLKRFPIKSHQNQLEISQLHPANYILKIIDVDGREVKTEKIIVVE